MALYRGSGVDSCRTIIGQSFESFLLSSKDIKLRPKNNGRVKGQWLQLYYKGQIKLSYIMTISFEQGHLRTVILLSMFHRMNNANERSNKNLSRVHITKRTLVYCM